MQKKKICQFGHASRQKLQKLVEECSIKDHKLLNLLNEIESNYEICTKYRKSSLKLAVGFSLSKEFNNVTSIDLKQINGTTFSDIIYNFARFSVAVAVTSVKCQVVKCQEEMGDIFIKHWNGTFRAPGMVIPDNKGELNNTLFTDMAKQFKGNHIFQGIPN